MKYVILMLPLSVATIFVVVWVSVGEVVGVVASTVGAVDARAGKCYKKSKQYDNSWKMKIKSLSYMKYVTCHENDFPILVWFYRL